MGEVWRQNIDAFKRKSNNSTASSKDSSGEIENLVVGNDKENVSSTPRQISITQKCKRLKEAADGESTLGISNISNISNIYSQSNVEGKKPKKVSEHNSENEAWKDSDNEIATADEDEALDKLVSQIETGMSKESTSKK